jgi:hypothetical protein
LKDTLSATLCDLSPCEPAKAHIKNIYQEGELTRESTVAKNATVRLEATRAIKRVIEYYHLDAIISVGYRVNSLRGTQFRQWACQAAESNC